MDGKSDQKGSSKTSFGTQQFTDEEKERIRNLLQQKLGVNDTTTRPGNSGAEFTYVESWKAIDLANDVFGYTGWSCSIVDITPDFIEEEKDKFRCGASAVVRITLQDGCYHEDVGYGCAENKNKGVAIENAKKVAVSDARKRSLRIFGNLLGNCLYDKEHLKKLKAEKKGPPNSQPTQAPSQVPSQTTQDAPKNIPMNQKQVPLPPNNPIKQQPTPTPPSNPITYGKQPPINNINNMRNNFNPQQNFVPKNPTAPAIYSSIHQTSDAEQISDHNDYGFDEFDGAYEEALIMAEASTSGIVRKNAPSNDDFHNVSPPDKKQKQNS